MQIKTFSILPFLFVIAAGALVPGSASFAARHHAPKPAPHKKAAAPVNAAPPLAAEAAATQSCQLSPMAWRKAVSGVVAASWA